MPVESTSKPSALVEKMPTREYDTTPWVSRLVKKPRPWIAASMPRPVLDRLPVWLMFWVSDCTCTPLAWSPAYTEAKLARLLLKP